MNERVIILGGPLSGKSTLSREFLAADVPVFCGDPERTVRETIPGVTYLPGDLAWSEGSQFIADNWFNQPGPWVCEGVAMPRAMRKMEVFDYVDSVIVFTSAFPGVEVSTKQEGMRKAVMTVWEEIKHHYANITEYRSGLRVDN